MVRLISCEKLDHVLILIIISLMMDASGTNLWKVLEITTFGCNQIRWIFGSSFETGESLSQ